MGCDGGSIAGRQELVKLKKKEVKESSTADYNKQRITHCAISQTPLIPPIVADHVGNLFNKSSLIEYLLSTSQTHTTQTQFSHITSLKDVINNVKLTYDESKKDPISGYAPYLCPITSLPANGRYRFVVMSGCGCVLSERAIKQVPSTKCLVCHADIITNPLIPNFFILAPTPEEYDIMHLEFEQRKQALKQQKKKGKKKGGDKEEVKEGSVTTSTSTSSPQSTSTSPVSSTTTTSPPSTSSATSISTDDDMPPPLESTTTSTSTSITTDRKRKLETTVTNTSTVTTTPTTNVKTTSTVVKATTLTKPTTSTVTSTATSTATSTPKSSSHVDKKPRVANRDAWRVEEAARIAAEQAASETAFWKDKSDVYKSLFRKPEKFEKPNFISSKPVSCMGML